MIVCKHCNEKFNSNKEYKTHLKTEQHKLKVKSTWNSWRKSNYRNLEM